MNATPTRARSVRPTTPHDAARARAANTHRRLGRLGYAKAAQYELAYHVTGVEAARVSLAVLTEDEHRAVIAEAELEAQRAAETAADDAAMLEQILSEPAVWTIEVQDRSALHRFVATVIRHVAGEDAPEPGRETWSGTLCRADNPDPRFAIAEAPFCVTGADAEAFCERKAIDYVRRLDESATWRTEMAEDRAAGRPWRRKASAKVWRGGVVFDWSGEGEHA